jgi:WD40 repeat protein
LLSGGFVRSSTSHPCRTCVPGIALLLVAIVAGGLCAQGPAANGPESKVTAAPTESAGQKEKQKQGWPALAKTPKDRYGDPLPAKAIVRFGTTRFRHPSNLAAVAIDPTGKTAITLSYGSPALSRCDLVTGEITPIPSPTRQFNYATSSRRSVLFLVSEGQRAILIGQNQVEAIALDKKVEGWKLALERSYNSQAAISPDGKHLALVQPHGEQKLLIVETEAGKVRHTIDRAGNSPTDVAFTHDSKFVTVSSHNQNEALRSWDIDTGKETPAWKDLKAIGAVPMALAYSPDGKYLALGQIQQTVTLVDLKERKATNSFGGLASAIRWLEFTTDSKNIVVLDQTGQAVVIESETGKESKRIQLGQSHTIPALSPDGKQLAAGTYNVVDVRNLSDNDDQPFGGHRSSVSQLAPSLDGRWLATSSSDNTVRLWDAASGDSIFEGRRQQYGTPSIAFTPDSKSLLWANSPTSIEFLNAAALPEKKDAQSALDRDIRGLPLQSFSLSTDGKTLAVSTNDGTGAQIFDLRQKTPVARSVKHPSGLQANFFAFSDDAQLAAANLQNEAGGTGATSIVDLSRGRELGRLPADSNNRTQGAFAGNRLFVWHNGRNVMLWDVLSNKVVLTIGRSMGAVTAVTASRDGRLISWATADSQRTIHLYDALAGKEIASFAGGHRGSITCLRLHLDDERPVLYSGSVDTTAVAWDLREAMDAFRRGTPQITTNEAERVWLELGAEDPVVMHRALWTLATAGETAVSMLARHLKPAPVDEELGPKVAKLVEQMNNDQFSVRERATQQVAELGEGADPFLRLALDETNSAEVRHRIRRLLNDLSGKPLVVDQNQQRALRGIQVLEEVGNEQACEVLERLATGEPAARMTQEAKSALARIEERQDQP